MMRATTLSAPHRLERDGLMPAIHTMLEQDFQHAFDEVIWEVSDETAACIDELTPPAIAELIFAAVQESLRNAARHARGADVHRRLRLLLKASCHPHLEVVVADDGIGIASATGTAYSVGAPLTGEKPRGLLSLASSSMQLEDGRLPASPLAGTIQRSSTSGTGSGLRTHSALLAIAGGSLTVKSAPGEGVTVRIVLPAESLRYR
jgi:signal transduction histidine kinase